MIKPAANALTILLGLLIAACLSLFIAQTQLAERYQQRLERASLHEKRPAAHVSFSGANLQQLLDSLKITGSATQLPGQVQQYQIRVASEPVAFAKINSLFQQIHQRNFRITACKIINADLQGRVYVQELIISR